MGQSSHHSEVLLLVAAFSRHDAALGWARDQLVREFGSVALESPTFDFTETDYYEATMGQDLRKMFLTFGRPLDPARLPEIKLQTNAWEAEYAALGKHPEVRPLNLDPGYLTLGKLVLASTKDHAHRIYLSRGIYAEVTLRYQHGRWQHHEWTYADYRREDYQRFFTQCRDYLRRQPREACTT